MKNIKTFEDACKKTGRDCNKPYSPFDKLEIITEAIVDGWQADYNDSNQRKWFPVFVWDKEIGAFRFNYAAYACTYARAVAGARLACETEEQAEYIGIQFIKECNDLMCKDTNIQSTIK